MRKQSAKGGGQEDLAGQPPRLSPIIRKQWRLLALVSITGVVYNVGMVAGPWLEGLLAQRLADIMAGSAAASAIAVFG